MADLNGGEIESKKTASDFERLVDALPQIYQPIFRHPHFDGYASRASSDRLAHIVGLYRLVEREMGRPLQVLDLGCAQGYFSLSLASLGADVLGADHLSENIDLCAALASEHPDLRVRFQLGRIEDLIEHIEHDRYDLVLGLSVFHHVVHAAGVAAVQKLLSRLARNVAVGAFELALPREPEPWAASQPEDPKTLLEGFAFVHEIAQTRTHLSTTQRPLYVASNRFWVFGERLGSFTEWKGDSHCFADGTPADHCATRRYFFDEATVVKTFQLDHPEYGDNNVREYRNESRFLEDPPVGFRAPSLVLHGSHQREAWIVRERLPGELLIDAMRTGAAYQPESVLHDVLAELAVLERHGLFHDDVRTWNILIGPNGGATLIDYGAISENQVDCAWPYDVFLSFIVLTREIFAGDAGLANPLRAPMLSPEPLPEPYRSALWALFESPRSAWRFSSLQADVLQRTSESAGTPERPHPGLAFVLKAFEDSSVYERHVALTKALVEKEMRIVQLTTSLREVDAESRRRIQMLLADVDRLRPLAEEADVRAQLLAENDLAQNELFRSLRERSSEVSTLSEALSTARAGWTAAADEAATLRSHLSVERAAAAERLELLHTTTEALQRQRDDSIAQSSALEALTRRADDLQQACDERAARASHESMEARIAVLEQACNERADLIDRLSAEAEMLRTVAAQRAEELAAVSDEAERRAVLIRELSRALDEDHPDGRLTIGPTDLRP